MRSEAELLERISNYNGARYLYTEDGYIAWQTSTGDNLEILFIEVREPRKGLGRRIMRLWLRTIWKMGELPYYSVSVTRLKSNEVAGFFYRNMGFKEHEVHGLYTEPAVLSTIDFEELCKNLSIK